MQSLNGKHLDMNSSSMQQQPQQQQQQQEPTSPTHNEDLIKYIHESWNKVSKEFEHFSQNGSSETTKPGTAASVRYFDDQDPNPDLKDFEPFDLDSWWGKRVVQSMQRQTS